MERSKYIWLWMAATVAMVLASYVWHGMLLTDIERVTLPAGMFMALYLLFYAVVAMLVVTAVTAVELELHPALKGAMLGGVLGFVIYLVAYATGLSFQEPHTDHLFYDFTWQMIEQAIGGFCCGLLYSWVRPTPRPAESFDFASLIRNKEQITS